MNVKKFSAATSREALHKLRDAMGPDAVIISNRNVNGQVEIMALAEDEMANLSDADDLPKGDTGASYYEPEFNHQELPASRRKNKGESAYNPILQSQAQFAMKKKQDAAQVVQVAKAEQMEHAHSGANASFNPDLIELKRPAVRNATATHNSSAGSPPELAGALELMSELRSMRGMMEAQLAEISWSNTQRKEPHKAQILREMLATGFSASLSRYLIEHMPPVPDIVQGLAWIKAILGKNLTTLASDSDMLEKGGIFALVGPTGVGKTTTTAKLAARCVMRHGANKLALITTDGYRIGGYEQLRIYGKILGVMVHAVKDETDLRIALSELKNKHTVLIDTVGMSQRDRLVSEQVAMLSGANVNKLLCLNATSTGETLNEVIRSYQGSGLSGCIITKMDEAASIGSVLDAVIRHKLTTYYLANGQRVPEDLHIANKSYLIDYAFKLKREHAEFQFQDNELPMLMANTSAAMHDRHLREVSLG
jgi:flagellar biosynthesis protein FlhF